MEFHKILRPKNFDHVIGQDHAVKMLRSMVKKKEVPHFLLFSGPSGCGKTTLGRIMRRMLNCGKSDFTEINAADKNGIETIRDLERRIHLNPINGDCRIWLIDEAHELTRQAQNALLKRTEETPEWAYIFFATTEPQRIIKTIRNRSTNITVKLVKPQVMEKYLLGVIKEHVKVEISELVVDRIVDRAEGSVRKALVYLGQVSHVEDEEEQLEVIDAIDNEKEGIDLCRVLINPRTADWKTVSKVLKGLEANGDAENLRLSVLNYAATVLMSGGKMSFRAAMIMELFQDNFYDSKMAGLKLACFNVVHNK